VGGGGKSSVVFRLAAEAAAQGRRAIVTHTARIAAFQTDWAPATVESQDNDLPEASLAAHLAAHGWCLLTGPIVGDRRAGLSAATVDRLAARAAALGVSLITVEADGSKMRPIKAPAEHEPVLPESTTLLAPVVGLDAIGATIDDRNVHRPTLVRQLLGLPDSGPQRLTPAQVATLLCAPAGGAKARPPAARFVPLLNKADSPLRLACGRLVAALLARQGQQALLTAAGRSNPHAVVERWGPIAVVVLAAGASRRMGRPKQLEIVDGVPMLARAVRTAVAAGLGPVFVVTGAGHEVLQVLLDPWQQAAGRPVHIVHNPHWEQGQASSMHRGLAAAGADAQAAIFLPVDQPYLDPQLLRQLAAAWRQGADMGAPLAGDQLRGAPAIFDRRHFPALYQVEGDTGGRALLQRAGDNVARIAAPPAWLSDVDRPEDLE
jgi:molybdenum cofactor cytidylyltransferase